MLAMVFLNFVREKGSIDQIILLRSSLSLVLSFPGKLIMLS